MLFRSLALLFLTVMTLTAPATAHPVRQVGPNEATGSSAAVVVDGDTNLAHTEQILPTDADVNALASTGFPMWDVKTALRRQIKAERVLVIAEDWQTSWAAIELDRVLREAGLRTSVTMMWNANNTYGFDSIDWPALQHAAGCP